jgi:hypothetical protein
MVQNYTGIVQFYPPTHPKTMKSSAAKVVKQVFTLLPLNDCALRRYSQSGNDRDQMVEIKKSRVSGYIFIYIHEQSDTVEKF